MFPLHYKTRRFFCRIGFVLLCLMPMAGMLAWGGWLQTDAYVAAWREEIQQRSGLQVKVEAVAHPEPRVTILEGLELFDLQTHERVVYVPRLEISARSGQRLLIATGPELHERAQSQLAAMAEQCWGDPNTTTIFVASSLTLHGPFGEERIKQVDLRLMRTTAGAELKCQFRREQGSAAEPVRLHLQRPLDATEPLLIELDTGGDAVPLALLQRSFPGLNAWGRGTSFQGTAKLSRDERGWQGEVRGSLQPIDLARAIAQNFPHRIDGQGELWLERLQIIDNRLAEAVGTFSGGQGLIGPSLRRALASELGMFASDVAIESHGLLEYENLAFDFKLNAEGVLLRGRCDQGPPGAIMIDEQRLLLGEPRRQPVSIAALIRALAPANEAMVPATRQTAWLLDVLPAAR